jgi:hypothetical protein
VYNGILTRKELFYCMQNTKIIYASEGNPLKMDFCYKIEFMTLQYVTPVYGYLADYATIFPN